MSSVNKVILIGRVGTDPEVRTSQRGAKSVSFSLATNEKRKDKVDTQWHKIVVYNEGLWKAVGSYIKKGDKIYLVGKLVTHTIGEGNEKKYVTRIELPMYGGELVILEKSFKALESDTPFTTVLEAAKKISSTELDDMADDIPF